MQTGLVLVQTVPTSMDCYCWYIATQSLSASWGSHRCQFFIRIYDTSSTILFRWYLITWKNDLILLSNCLDKLDQSYMTPENLEWFESLMCWNLLYMSFNRTVNLVSIQKDEMTNSPSSLGWKTNRSFDLPLLFLLWKERCSPFNLSNEEVGKSSIGWWYFWVVDICRSVHSWSAKNFLFVFLCSGVQKF